MFLELSIIVMVKITHYICDEIAAGSKSTDHTISFFQHFILTHVGSWVRNLTICLDNTRICKNRYLVAWAYEVVTSGRFESVRFIYNMTVGHTKFKPDRLFASIAKYCYERDVFFVLKCFIQLLSSIQ